MSTPGFKSVGGVGRIFRAMRYSAQGFQAAFLHFCDRHRDDIALLHGRNLRHRIGSKLLHAKADALLFGIDIEHRPALAERLWKMVFLAEEQAFLATLDPALRARTALVLFSAKESLYKAQHPRTRLYMGFSELRVHVTALDAHTLSGTLACEFQRDVGCFPRGAEVPGRFLRLPSGEIVSGVHITDAHASGGRA